MTTELTNISSAVVARQPNASQLPTFSSNTEKDISTQPDNVIRVSFDQRQEVANTGQVNDQYSQAVEQKTASITRFQESVQELNNSTQLISRNLEFRVDDKSGKTVITVRDSETNEVIRQIPSEQFLEVSGKLKELQDSKLTENAAAGILFNGQV